MPNIVVMTTTGLGEILERNAQAADLPAYLAHAQKKGSVGISVHTFGGNGCYITGEVEAQDLAKRLAADFV